MIKIPLLFMNFLQKNNKLLISVIGLVILLSIAGYQAYSNPMDTSPAPSRLNLGNKYVRAAYVLAEKDSLPDPELFNMFIYAFCEFNDENDGLIIPNSQRLRKISDLKKKYPDLKVIFSVGGSKYEGFSEMAKDKRKRLSFARSCKAVIDSLNLDGISLDWEYPGTSEGGHSSSADDTRNYVEVVRNLRKILGKDKWISFFSSTTSEYIDYKGMLKFVDFVEVPGYDYNSRSEKLQYHNALYKSDDSGRLNVEKCVKEHVKKGVPRKRMMLAIPFYARGRKPFPRVFSDFKIPDFKSEDLMEGWDDKAKVPFYKNSKGELVLSFENEKSIAAKSDFIKENGLAGSSVWHYDADFPDHRLAKSLKKNFESEQK